MGVKTFIRNKEYLKAHEILPSEGKLFVNLAKASPDVMLKKK